MNKIPYEKRCEVYLKAIWKFGTSLQLLVAIEEMSEVIKSITKMERRFHQPHTAEELAECKASIIEEVADATIIHKAAEAMSEYYEPALDYKKPECDVFRERMDKRLRKIAAEKTPSLADVRAVLAVKTQNGMTAEVKGLITKYGGTKLSDVDPKHYADLIKDAEVLGNG